jgi:hypothetical protein
LWTGRLLTSLSAGSPAARIGVQDVVEQRPAMREIGPDGRDPQPAEVHPQHPAELARYQRRTGSLGNQFRHEDRLAELHQHVAAVKHDHQQLAQAADQLPVLGEQELEQRAFLVRRAAPEHRDGNDHHLRHAA